MSVSEDVSVYDGSPISDPSMLLDYGGSASGTLSLSKDAQHFPHPGFRPEISHWGKEGRPVPTLSGDGFESHHLALRAFKNATVQAAFAIASDSSGRFLKETTGAIEFRFPEWRNTAIGVDVEMVDKAMGGHFLLSTHGNYGVYAHFLLETVCTIFSARDLFLRGKISLIMPSAESEFPDRLLDFIGFPRANRCRIPGKSARLENLIVSSSCSGGSTFKPCESIKDMAGYFVKKWGVKNRPRVRLYLTRTGGRNTAVREYLEEAALIRKLEDLGFVSINPGLMSFQEQVATFSRAEAVVGPHGSAFANLIFAPSDCIVVDILPSHWALVGGGFTANLTNLFGHRYGYMLAESSPVKGGHKISLDPEVVVNRLRSFMSN